LHHKVKVLLIINEHRYTHRLATKTKISLDFFTISSLFGWEENRILLCRSNTIEDYTIIVLASKGYI